MRFVIVGLGIQGEKRKKNCIKKELIATVDKYKKTANFKNLYQVPKEEYDTVFICTPDDQKRKLIDFCVKEKKNFLVEKPILDKRINIHLLAQRCKKAKIVGYTAYNHRFEPHFLNIKKFLNYKKIGKIYYIKIFYGNGTSKLVKKNPWKDYGNGVISDLGSHLIDTINFWFNYKFSKFKLIKSKRFENKSPDYMQLLFNNKKMFIELEATLCMWKNTFTCEIIGSKGSLLINGLCKWGPSKLIFRKRKYPAGVPYEKIYSIKMKDPTWKKEYYFFKKLIKNKSYDNFKSDKLIKKIISNL